MRSAGCDSKACGLFEALLDAFAIVGSDASGDCAADLGDAETLFVQGAAALTAGDVEAGLFDFSVALGTSAARRARASSTRSRI